MIPPLTPLAETEKELHQSALDLSRQHRQVEWRIIEVLQKIDRRRLYRKFGSTSLYKYAVDILGLSDSVAYSLISVARKSVEIPALGQAIQAERLTANKASRIIAALDRENAERWIEFACTHSARETDREVARHNPKAARFERTKDLDEDTVEVRITISRDLLDQWRRCQDLETQRTGRRVNLRETLQATFDFFAKQKDPVEAAKRAMARKAKRKAKSSELCTYRVPVDQPTAKPPSEKPARRQPLTAEQKHPVVARDQGRCTFRDPQGRRCDNQAWLQLHHLVPVSRGGRNDPANLTTLCSSHHDLVHQLSLPLEGQVTWLKAPRARYG